MSLQPFEHFSEAEGKIAVLEAPSTLHLEPDMALIMYYKNMVLALRSNGGHFIK